MAHLGTIKGTGTLTIRAVMVVFSYGPVSAHYQIDVHASPDGTKYASSTLTADPEALFKATGPGHPYLKLETGEVLEMEVLNIDGGRGQFHVKSPVPDF